MKSADASPPQGHVTRVLLIMGVLQALLGGLCEASWAQGTPLTFSVTGDVPYSEGDWEDFRGYIDDHNLYSPSEFLIHIGDIKNESDPRVDSASRRRRGV